MSSVGLQAADFSVSTPGSQFAFAINSLGNDPTLTLVRGQTYTFAINTTPSFHPFEILSDGVVNNNITSGTITYTVPMVASNYHYICSIHFFGGTIMTVPAAPPPPPTIKILNLSVNSNLVLTSTGTNTYTVVPQYSTNLATTNWYSLTVVSNNYTAGTNETICGRPPGNAVYLRLLEHP